MIRFGWRQNWDGFSSRIGGMRGTSGREGGFGAAVLGHPLHQRGGNFVIRKGSIRSSFNAFLIKLKDHPNVGAYERDGWVINRWGGDKRTD